MCVVMSRFEGNTRDYIGIPSSYDIQTTLASSFPVISDSKLLKPKHAISCLLRYEVPVA